MFAEFKSGPWTRDHRYRIRVPESPGGQIRRLGSPPFPLGRLGKRRYSVRHVGPGILVRVGRGVVTFANPGNASAVVVALRKTPEIQDIRAQLAA